jgi:hypothetical protein
VESLDDQESVRRRVETWLADYFDDVEPFADDTALWHLSATRKAGGGIQVVLLVDNPERLIVQSCVTLKADYKQRYKNLPSEERREFIYDLQLRLLNMDVDYDGVDDPLDTVRISQHVFIESLDRERFVRKLRWVNKGALSVMVMLAQRLPRGRVLEHIAGDVTIH